MAAKPLTWIGKIRRKLLDAPSVHRYLYLPYLAARYHLPTSYRREWVRRVDDVMRCPDMERIPRVVDAGRIRGRFQVMHNGLRVVKNEYYAYPITVMLRQTGGVHEPQEECVFGEVLRHMPAHAVMIELGAYWGFYSMWFNQRVPQARNYLVEPEPVSLNYGKQNFAANGMRASFSRALVGGETRMTADGTPIICVDDFVAQHGIHFIHILHADIQGSEVQMLAGADRTLRSKDVGYLFISTHSEALHVECRRRLRAHDYQIVADASPRQSYSYDGLVVAKSPHVTGPQRVPISQKTD